MDTEHSTWPETDAVANCGGLLLLRRTVAAIFIPLGAILLALAAGAALNPPTSDTITVTTTNAWTMPIDNVRIHDTAVEELGGTLACPGTTLEPGQHVSCSADIPGKAESARAARTAAGALVGAVSVAGGVLFLRFPRQPMKAPGNGGRK